MNTPEQLLTQAAAILDTVPALATRRDEIAALRSHSGFAGLYVGVVGVTSSGKSTFVNALMGESLLPEEGRVTTNVIVKCRHGSERGAKTYFKDKRVLTLHGRELTEDSLAAICSETRNPRNRAGLNCIEWTTPTSCIPPGMTVIDTPGLDGAGYGEHQDITLRQAVPMADIVIYMTSIRNPFKSADLSAVATLLEYDQRVLFLLTQIDLERDSYEGTVLIKSRSEKLNRHRQRLESDILRIKGLRNCGIELVSSWWAKQGLSNRSDDSWERSGFSRVIDRLQQLAADLKDSVEATRVMRTRVLLERTLKELEQAELNAGHDTPRPKTNQHSRVQELNRAVSRMRSIVEASAATAKCEADYMRLAQNAQRSGEWSVGTAQALFRETEDQVATIRKNVLAVTDRALVELRSELEHLSIMPARATVAHRQLASQSLAHAEQFVTTEEVRVETRGWFDSLLFWPKSETRLIRRFSNADAARALDRFIRESASAATEFLNWWREHVTSVFVEPVSAEYASEAAAARDVDKLIEQAKKEAARIRAARKALAELLAMNVPVAAPPPIMACPSTEVRTSSPAAGVPHAGTALQPLLARFREREFRRVFDRAVGGVKQGAGPLLALGRDRTPHFRLLSLLAHDLSALDRLTDTPDDAWITIGDATATLPGPVQRHTLFQATRDTIIVAPNDEQLPDCDWATLLASASAIVVEIDAPRIGAGLSDLARAPYQQHLRLNAGKVLFTCANGALFSDNRFGELIRDVVPELTTAFGVARLFVYEDYDVRHTLLLELHATSLQSGNPRQLVRQWKDAGLHFGHPFTRAALNRLAIDLGYEPEHTHG